MKIAVQFFGHLRTYEKCYESIQDHILSQYDCDVFMHTWSTLNHNTKTWHENKYKENGSTFGRENELKEKYQLKSLKVEEQVPVDMGTFFSFDYEMSIFGAKSMFHSMQEANKLRERYQNENNIEYDFVLVIRPDILLKRSLCIKDYLANLKESEIDKMFFTAGNPLQILSYFPFLKATDVLFFAKPQLLSNLYNNQDLFLSLFSKDVKVPYGPERYFIQSIEALGYTPILINFTFAYDFDIVRPPNTRLERRDFIRLKIDKYGIKFHLLKKLRKTIFRLRIDIASLFQIDFCIGAVYLENEFIKQKGKK